jgi:hypothetical protein
MKLKYVDYYEKGVSRVENGVPVIINGRIAIDKKPMYLYAVTNATPEEITLYKRFKRDNPDNKDYYRESENGVPLWHSTEMVGFTADVSMFKDRDGKIRFRINKAMQGALEGFRAQFPSLSDKIDDQLWALLASGGPTDITKLGSAVVAGDEGIDEIVDHDDTAADSGGSDDSTAPESES